jgi:hypothetical protein
MFFRSKCTIHSLVCYGNCGGTVRPVCAPAVRFSGEEKVEEGPEGCIELGLLKPERTYEATIYPVAEGTTLANVKASEGLSVEIRTPEEADGPAVTCVLTTPRDGEVIHFFSADFVDEAGEVKHRAFSITAKVVSAEKGANQRKPTIQNDSNCLN